MKALHAGLLVVGAVLAGGLALRLTEAPVIVSTPVSVPPPTLPAPQQSVPEVVTPPPRPATRWRPAEPAVASAPPPVYTEPPPVPLPRPKPSPLPKPVPYREPPLPPAPKPEPARSVTLQSGAGVAIELAQPLSAERMSRGDVFRGVLAEPLVADGLVVGERGAQVTGRVLDIKREGLTLRLLNFQTADGQRIEISTEPVTILNGNVIRFRLTAQTTITERRI